MGQNDSSMFNNGIRLTSALVWLLLGCGVLADTSTRVVSVTSTTTVHVTATDYAGACENFVGACVVYGTYASAPYTTTVYRYNPTQTPSPSSPPPPPTVVTSTRVIVASTTVSDQGACSGFRGACVVYGTGGGPASSTVYYAAAGSSAAARPGNGQGYIGAKKGDDGDGVIGGAAGIDRWTWITVLGAALICAMLLL